MYNFDKVIERRKTNSKKYDGVKAKNPKIIPMWVADMDFETLPEIKEVLIKRAQHGIFGYADITDSYYDAVINWMKNRHNFLIKKDWIVTTTGVVTALKLAVRAYTKKNENVMILKPVYYPFDLAIELNKRNIVECPLILKDNSYNCDYDLFEQCIVKNNVKLFILCNPHNPIGKVWKREDLYKMGMICKKHHVIIISDEIHMDFVYNGHKHYPLYNVDKSFKDFSIICTAPSKTFNLAALQTSNIIIANENLRKKFVEEKTKSGVTNPNIFGLDACETAYTYGATWVDELLKYLANNIKYMKEFFNKYLPEFTIIDPEGLYLVWVDFRSLHMNDEELENFMLNKANLWLDEGYIFGTGGSGFERFNIACPRSTLKKALEQLRNAVYEIRDI